MQGKAVAAAGAAGASAAAEDSGQEVAGAGAEQPAKRQRREAGVAPKPGRSTDSSGGDGGGCEGPVGGVPLVLAPVVGGSVPEERARSAKAAASKPVAGGNRPVLQAGIQGARCGDALACHCWEDNARPQQTVPSSCCALSLGFALSGFGMGEDASLHPQLLAAAVEHLPEGKPRLLLGMVRPAGSRRANRRPLFEGPGLTGARTQGGGSRQLQHMGHACCHPPLFRGLRCRPEQRLAACRKLVIACPSPRPPQNQSPQASPEEVLEGVLQGADLFDCGYPTHATANGYALCFPLRPPSSTPSSAAAAAAGPDPSSSGGGGPNAGEDDSKVNLWAQQYRLDKGPLVPGCSCFACRNHTRAYVHHLLHQHEMLASVLLEVHNTHWWLGFFEALRGAVGEGRLAQYAGWFRARRAAARRPPDA
jgi:hypothetical protein